jgi:lysophospholipase L1-like esterase
MAPQTHCLRVTEQSKIDGRTCPELFVKNRLHFSPEGYEMLAGRVRPFLAQ